MSFEEFRGQKMVMNKQKIPETDSIQELARFWDTHDLTDFEEELEEVKNRFLSVKLF